MYRYYIERNFNPTYAKLDSTERLQKFMKQRCYILQNRLCLPVRMFDKCDILEFGPAGGENALISAMLGANMYLVEPVKDFHQTIRNYFEQYKQESRLKLVAHSTLSEFVSEKLFEMIVAEGFVHTTEPARRWTKELAKFCSEYGFVLLNMNELGGFLIEMLQSRVCQISSRRNNMDEIETAKIILGRKWDSINHTRSFESWANDVLYNPYTEYKYLNHSGDIVELMYGLGFDLYSSCPSLRQTMGIRWIKYVPTRQERLAKYKSAALQILPSLILGKSIKVKNAEDKNFRKLLSALKEELSVLSDLTGEASTSEITKVIEKHRECAGVLDDILVDYQDSLLARLMKEIKDSLLSLDEQPEKLAQRFGTDRVLGTVWGSPNQYLVFQRSM